MTKTSSDGFPNPRVSALICIQQDNPGNSKSPRKIEQLSRSFAAVLLCSVCVLGHACVSPVCNKRYHGTVIKANLANNRLTF